MVSDMVESSGAVAADARASVGEIEAQAKSLMPPREYEASTVCSRQECVCNSIWTGSRNGNRELLHGGLGGEHGT